MGQEKPPALSPNRHIMQAFLNFLHDLLEAFLCPLPRLEYAGIGDCHRLTETNNEHPTLASFFGGKTTSSKNNSQASSQAAAWTPPPVPAPAPIPVPPLIPPPATTSGSDAAMQQQDLAQQNAKRNGYSRTLLAGESNQPSNAATGNKTLLG